MIEERRSVGAAYDATFFVPLRDRVRIYGKRAESSEACLIRARLPEEAVDLRGEPLCSIL